MCTKRFMVLAALLAAVTLAVAPAALAQDEYVAQREAMVDSLVAEGIITDARVIAAMKKVPRHLFVPHGQVASAYDDTPLPIGDDQLIYAPSIVGLMTEALQPQETDRVLEVGTGSGYQAAILAELARHVYSTEVLEALAVSAQSRLQEMGYTKITVRNADGHLGWPEHAPYDRIIVNGAADEVPQALVDQLKDGGRMVIPISEEGGWAQKLYLMVKQGDELVKTELADAIFVPMAGSAAENGE